MCMPGVARFDSSQKIAVVVGVEPARQPALYADLARAALPGFFGAAGDLFEGVKVSVLFARRAAEGAKPAADETDVREVDVAVDDVSDHITDALAPHAVCRKHQRFQLSRRSRTQARSLSSNPSPRSSARQERARHAALSCEQQVEPVGLSHSSLIV